MKTVNYYSSINNNNNSIIGATTIQHQQHYNQKQQQQRLVWPVRMMSSLYQVPYRTTRCINSNNILFKLNHSTTTNSISIRTLSTVTAPATATTDESTSTDDIVTTTTKTDATTNTNDIPSIPPILWTTHRLNQQQIYKVDTIFHKILWLDLFESSMLNDIINDKMGITLTNKQTKQLMNLMEQRAQEAAGNISSSSNNNNDNVEEEVAGPVLVDIKLTSFDTASKIKVIKEVRSILSLGLKEAKEMVESAPITLQKGIKEEVANELKIKLETVGAKIEII